VRPSDRIGAFTRQVDPSATPLGEPLRARIVTLATLWRNGVFEMDKDRVKGAAQQQKGAVKEGLGKIRRQGRPGQDPRRREDES